jgi:DNA-directed RNA polymerase subunit omega
MARVTVEDCLHVVENRFALCVLTVKRGRQLMSGARSVVEEAKERKDKSAVLALREIATGKVRFDRNVKDVLMGKFNPPPVEVKLVPAGSGRAATPAAPPSGGLF